MTTKNNTSNDLLKTKRKATQKQIEEFDLDKHLVKLLWEEPFYSRILRSLNKIESKEIPTAGVLELNGDLTLWWNREFLASLTKSQVLGLLKHECLHLVFEHTTSRKRTPHMIWNYATDLAINSTIPEHELPEGGLIPGKALPQLTDTSSMTEKEIERYYEISRLIASFPKDKTSDFYFERLMSNSSIQEMIEEGTYYSIGNMDDHEGWDTIAESEMSDLLKEKVKELIKDAASDANSKHWGTVSSEVQKAVNKLITNKIQWGSLLKRFCGFNNRSERVSSIMRLNRKYPGIQPGIKKDYKPNIVVYIDESGSVTDKDLSVFYSELDNLSKLVNFTVYKFDYSVDEKNFYSWKKGRRPDIKRTLTGGTSFRAPTEHVKKLKGVDGYIIMTDGYAAKPKHSRIKRAWVITEHGNLAFEKDKKDVLIKIESE